MPDKPGRSAFLPLLFIIVGLVVCAGVVLVFVPMVECNVCLGGGTCTVKEYLLDYAEREGFVYDEIKEPDVNEEMALWYCRWCSGKSKIPLFQRWGMEIPVSDRSWEIEQIIRCSRRGDLKNSTP